LIKPNCYDLPAHLIMAFMWLVGGLCVWPVLYILSGLFWCEGHLSLAHLHPLFASRARLAELASCTAIVTAGTVGLSLLIGVPAGFLCFRTNLPLRRLFIIGFMVAACIPLHIVATCWMALFGLNFWMYSPLGAAWINGMAYIPMTALITGICFATGDRDLEEITAIETGRRGVFRHVVIPHGGWGIVMAAIVVTVLSLWDITVTDVLMVRSFAEEVFTQFQLGAGPWTAAAVSLPVIVLSAVLLMLAYRVMAKYGTATPTDVPRSPALMVFGPVRYVFLAILSSVAVLFFAVPIIALVKAVGSFSNLVIAWRASEDELLNTLLITPIAATVAVGIAIVGAWAMARTRHVRWLIGAVVVLLLSTPAPVVGMGLATLMSRSWMPGLVYDSQFCVIMAYVIRTLPFGVLLLLPAVRRIPREQEEAVALEGGSWLRKMWAIVIPGCRRAMVVAWFLVFVLALSDLGASFLVAPPGQATLSIRFFTLIHYGVYPDAAGICLILLGIVGLSALVIAGMSWTMLKEKVTFEDC
jgi:iron(III) transport system permease protein